MSSGNGKREMIVLIREELIRRGWGANDETVWRIFLEIDAVELVIARICDDPVEIRDFSKLPPDIQKKIKGALFGGGRRTDNSR